MRLPKTQGQSCPQPAEAREIQKQKEQRSGEREVPTQPLGVYQASPREAGMGQRGEGHSAGLKMLLLIRLASVSPGLPLLLPG